MELPNEKTYLCIDLKSFYASVECVERGLDPLTTNLVVADESRTEKTICLAVSPSLKAYGISGRPRLFEVNQQVRKINLARGKKTKLIASSYDDTKLKEHINLALDFIIAPPRMTRYIEYSSKIYGIYLKYLAPEDIHVYSIDEVFMDITNYLNVYKLTKEELTARIIKDVYQATHITATAGLGTNMYLAKVAMDIVAKHLPVLEIGARIATLDEMSYRQKLWSYKPLKAFWRVGYGYAKKLNDIGLYTMGDIARCSLENEDILYRLFGVNAELLIDHAWGYEPCTMEAIKNYKPNNNSLGTGQVLHAPYPCEKAKIVVLEMVDSLALDLVDKNLVCDAIHLVISYEAIGENDDYDGDITIDHYGRKKPKHAKGIAKLKAYTSSSRIMMEAVSKLYDQIIDEDLLVRRIYVSCYVISKNQIPLKGKYEQLALFIDYTAQAEEQVKQTKLLEKEQKAQETILAIKKRYGKNAVLKGIDLEDGATAKDRNKQIGGHKA